MAREKETEKTVEYKRFKGVYNLEDVWRVRPQESSFLSGSSNCFADKTEGMVSREGYLSRDSGSYHSLWRDGGINLGVVNNNLCRIYISGNSIGTTVLQSRVGDNRFNFTMGDKIYGTNSLLFGYLDLASNSWVTPSGTTQTFKRVMPAGHLIEWFNGRLYIALNNLVVISDPMAPIIYDVREDKSFIQMGSKLTMMAGVDDGLWVSDENEIVFLPGAGPTNFSLKPVVDYKVIEGSYTKKTGIVVRDEFYPSCVFMTTSKGICLGGNGGKFINLTELNFNMPNSTTGFGFLRRGTYNQYITVVR